MPVHSLSASQASGSGTGVEDTLPGNPIEVVVLAAGKGTRMRSALPKVLHGLAGKSMLEHVLHTASLLHPRAIHVVVGHGAEQVQAQINENGALSNLHWVQQKEQLGTGHAVKTALPGVKDDSTVLVLYGDVPLTPIELLRDCVRGASQGPALITANMPDPAALGRIIRNPQTNAVERIVEFKDASPEQRAISEINSGIMAGSAAFFKDHLGRLNTDNAQGEYYLTDVIESACADGLPVTGVVASSPYEVAGVNDRVQLAELERVFQGREAEALMLSGATLLDPDRVDVRGNVQVGQDCIIDINVILEGEVTIGANVEIGAGCILRNTRLGDNTVIHPHSIVDGANVGMRCAIGPFARIRPGSDFAHDVKVGNFVETKKTSMGNGSKASHLTYLGDAQVGELVNIGAGTVTCNYDGVNKHRTNIGDDVFIGTNSTLVAPIEIDNGGFVAAGSTLTSKVKAGDLAVGRARQRNIEGWKRPDKR